MVYIVFVLLVGNALLASGRPASNSGFILKHFKHIVAKTSLKEQAYAVEQLIKRLVPNHVDQFVIVVNDSYFNRKFSLDSFEIQSTLDGKIQITANSGVAASAGFNHYLKYFCNAHVSWSGVQLNLPGILPKVNQPLRIDFPDRFRYYQNVCTVSYSMAFWNWTRWEKEIDWMALNGINLPLAFTGQESIWQIVYKHLGLTQLELDKHFAGPAFLAWQRMGNLDAWGGPLPTSWYSQQLNLQNNILIRMRSLGMVPVLPAFAGHIPKALVNRLYPTAKFFKLNGWNNFNGIYGTYLLDPTDPLFPTVGRLFIKTQEKVYNGTDHVYNGDVFNEMSPPTSTPQFMANISRSMYKAMSSIDPQAVWMIQGWAFKSTFWKPALMKAWFNAIPFGKLIILDLDADLAQQYVHTDAYYSHPFIWNMIENFGGVTRLYGSFDIITNRVLEARLKYKPYMIGTGLTPEGIEQNDIIFEVMNEMAWRVTKFDAKKWVQKYALRRYGSTNKYVDTAWNNLISTVYNSPGGFGHFRHDRLPVTKPTVQSITTALWYPLLDIFYAWSNMSVGAAHLTNSETFRYDLVKLGVQVLEDFCRQLFNSLLAAYRNKSMSEFVTYSHQLKDVFIDMDTVLSTEPHSLLGTWIESAKSLGMNKHERNILEFNARNQITLWGPEGQISDYANKNWAGLIESYYTPRWDMFFYFLSMSLQTGLPFNSIRFNTELLQFGIDWDREKTLLPIKVHGDAVTVSQKLVSKYSRYILSI